MLETCRHPALDVDLPLKDHPDLANVLDIYRDFVCSYGRPPTRREIDPLDYRAVMRRIVLAELHPETRRVRLRLVGEHLSSVFHDDWTGAYFDEKLDALSAQVRYETFANWVEGELPTFGTRRIRMKDGTEVRYKRLGLPLTRVEGEPAMAMVVVSDLTTQTSKTREPYATDLWTLLSRGALSLR
ncbi:PAS domain-containing protein [Fodinicurvata halophila]|uniref:PAS domain-containing protein n=1 Tax=Fodinicurvata halophila TaxID=1419723 RepID=A0ABV8UK02_9PROT